MAPQLRIHMFLISLFALHVSANGEPPTDVSQRWLAPQSWTRDMDAPVVSLGESGTWDDMHIFAPCVAFENGAYTMWYSGSRGDVEARLFHMGRATSSDGVHFAKDKNPVYSFGDGTHSVLTPAILRDAGGRVLRENGELRMWFACADLTHSAGLHTLRETRSADGVQWSPPSSVQLENVYAPTIVKHDGTYRMWCTDVSADPWVIRHAQSLDGVTWAVTEQPCVVIDQPWEKNRLFYSTVLMADGVYLMWYGSYWNARPNTTALGFAFSEDGLTWRKCPNNPVFTPDPNRPWESHYTTSQSVLRLDDGSFRIWYASRNAPPFKNKYFAICTARWPES